MGVNIPVIVWWTLPEKPSGIFFVEFFFLENE